METGYKRIPMPGTAHKRKLRLLVKKYQDGTATEQERSFVERYYQSFEQKRPVSETLSAAEKEEIETRILHKIQAGIEREQVPVVPLYRRRIKRITAAAAVLILAVSIFLLTRNTADINFAQTAPVNDVLPGTNKATLTLASGEVIVLDSARQGLLATEGSATVQNTGGSLTYQLNGAGTAPVYNTLTTQKGEQYPITLSDGTKVWLNSSSSLYFPVAFAGKERTVQITGEAYLEVAKDRARPFHVKVNDMDIEVLGTHFNVNAYANEAVVATTLVEGSVKVRAGNKSVLLHPGQQSLVQKGNISVSEEINIEEVTAWKDGYFLFNKTELQVILRQLERWYDIEIRYEGAIPKKRYAGEISRNSNLSAVLKILAESGIQFRMEGKKLIVIS